MDTVQTYDPTYHGATLGGAGRSYVNQDGPPCAPRESRGMSNLEAQTNTLETRVRALAEEVEQLMSSVGLGQLSPLNTGATDLAPEESDNRIDVVAQNIRALRLFTDHIGNCVAALRERIA